MEMALNPQDVEAVLNFWFLKGTDQYGQPRVIWFRKNETFDEEIRAQFLPLVERIEAGQIEIPNKDNYHALLAFIVACDQFPRNLFRNSPRAFAFDRIALQAARIALANTEALPKLLPVEQAFIFIPFEHSESLEDQQLSVRLYDSLKTEGETFEFYLEAAKRHLYIIERFGRFPHRNACLGRESSPEEDEFLAQPGSSF